MSKLIEVDKLIAEFDEIANSSSIGGLQTLPINHIKKIINGVQTVETDKVIMLSQTAKTDEVLEFLRGQKLGRLQGFEQAREKYERPQGEWIFVNPLQADDGGAYMCSNCKTGDYGVERYKYCPFCGAEMRGKEE